MKKTFIFLVVILIIQACNNKGEILYVEANQNKGFNYPYFLFIPGKISNEKELFIIIEPNNSGFADDDLKRHIEKAERTASKDFYFMGALDANDAVPYDDAFDQDERELIYELLGKEMLPTRWKACANIYKNEGVNASVKTYSNIGHENPDSVKQEIVEFFKTCLNY